MSQEQIPRYQYPRHLETYDIEGPRQADGEIGFVMDTLDDILYAGGGTVIQPNSASVSEGLFESHFSYQYLRAETSFLGLAWPLEQVTVSIDHARYLGSTALKQSYKIQLDNSILQASSGPNKITTIYDLEEVAGKDHLYFGTMIRPDIMKNADICLHCEGACYDTHQEQVTAYDCDTLYGVLDQVILSIKRDQQDRAVSNKGF